MDSERSTLKKTFDSVQCEVSDIWYILGRTWALAILKNMSTKEPIRFNDWKGHCQE